MSTYTVHQAKTNLSKLIEAAERGEEVIIARGDKPAARLTVIEPEPKPRPKRQPGALKGLIYIPDSFFDPMTEEELKLWEEGHEGDPLRLPIVKGPDASSS